MKRVLSALTLAILSSGTIAVATPEQEPRGRMERTTPMTRVDRILREWPDSHVKTAHELISRYGRADEVTENALVWRNNGPWVRTMLMKEEFEHNWPSPHVDYLQQGVYMKVPKEKVGDIARFDGSVIVDRTSGVVWARCGGEPANLLALNLTHDIVNGKRTWQDARKFYEKTMRSDAPSDYTERLRFRQPSANAAADPDTAAKSGRRS